jgi:hypothetical protein
MLRVDGFLLALLMVAVWGGVVCALGFAQTSQPPGASAPRTQSTPPTFPPGTARQPNSGSKASESKAAGKTKSFVGTVVKESTGYALHVGDLSYKLDDQNQAESHVGQTVKVFGNLDKQTNTIQIKQIEQLSSPPS